jgi:hypothetical protein
MKLRMMSFILCLNVLHMESLEIYILNIIIEIDQVCLCLLNYYKVIKNKETVMLCQYINEAFKLKYQLINA